jgi:hypothetical protein
MSVDMRRYCAALGSVGSIQPFEGASVKGLIISTGKRATNLVLIRLNSSDSATGPMLFEPSY